MTDEQLIEQYKLQGDMNALGILYDRYVTLTFGVCMKYLKDPVESEDASMEIFEQLVIKLKKHEVSQFRGWLYVLARNHCLQKLRKSSRTREFHEEIVVHSHQVAHHVDEYVLTDDINNLKTCLETLPENQQVSVRMFYYESKSYQEIAKELTVQNDKIRSYIQNGRRNLRNCMEKYRVSE